MIFGLGSGLSFIYWHSKQMPYPFVGGRARDFDKSLCANLGVSLKINKTSSKTRAYEDLKTMISKDQPVMIHVDMPYLKYLGLPEQAHFGAHVVVVAGLDEDKCVAYIARQRIQKLADHNAEGTRRRPFVTFQVFPSRKQVGNL